MYRAYVLSNGSHSCLWVGRLKDQTPTESNQKLKNCVGVMLLTCHDESACNRKWLLDQSLAIRISA